MSPFARHHLPEEHTHMGWPICWDLVLDGPECAGEERSGLLCYLLASNMSLA